MAVFEDIKLLQDWSPKLMAVSKRHLARTAVVGRMRLAVAELGPMCDQHPEWVDLMESKAAAISATQVVEDINGLEANSTIAPTRQFRKMSTLMAGVLSKPETFTERHHYTMIDSDVPALMKKCRLPESDWAPCVGNSSMDFSEVSSTDQQASWYSTSAERACVPHADLPMLRELHGDGNLAGVSKAWMGLGLKFQHSLLIEMPAPMSKSLQWYMCLSHIPDSSCLLWPVRLCELGPETLVQPLAPLPEPTLRPVVDLAKYKCHEYSWRSWLWQVLHIGAQANAARMRPGIRAFLRGKKLSWMELACLKAFYKMSYGEIKQFAQEFGVPFEPGCTLFELLWACIKAFHDLSDQDILRIIYTYRVCGEKEIDATCAILDVEEACEVLEHQDEKLIKDQQEVVRGRTAERKALKQSCLSKAREIRAAGGGLGAAAAPIVGPKRVLPAHIAQKDAKRFIPPNCSIWVSATRGEWNGHTHGHPHRVYEPFNRYGSSEEALHMCLRRLWLQFLEPLGLDGSSCPVEGLF